MAPAYQTVSLTTDGDGDATVYSGKVTGRIVGIFLDYGDTLTGMDLTITTETTGQAVMTKADVGVADAWFYPRVALNKASDGSALTFYEPVWANGERIKIVAAEGGDTKTSAIGILVDAFPYG